MNRFLPHIAAFSLWLAAGSAVAANPDSLSVELREVNVVTRTATRLISAKNNKITLSKSLASEMPRFMGTIDPLRILQTLPAVATNNDLSAGISVQGCDHSHNLHSIDGMEVVNPTHMLGLFSVFNMDHFRSVDMVTGHKPSIAPNHLGAWLQALTSAGVDTTTRATATLGIIEANGTIAIPLKKNASSLSVSGRRSFIDLLFPDILNFDHASLKYHFTDFNATYTHLLNKQWSLKGNFFFSSDKMRMNDNYYESSGLFAWRNIDASLSLMHEKSRHIVALSNYNNQFILTENTSTLDLPSRLMKIYYSGSYRWRNVQFGAEAAHRRTRRQKPSNAITDNDPANRATELSVAADCKHSFSQLTASAGIKATYFSGSALNRFYPQPRLALTLNLPREISLTASYDIFTQFTHLIKESGTGLPVDFWINSSAVFMPQVSHSSTLKLSAPIFDHGLMLTVETYYKTFNNVVEFDGGLLNMVNSIYDPLDDVMSGHGRAYGVSISLMREIGNLRGWLGYTLGKSENRFQRLGPAWFPSDHDRLHDFKATLNWHPSAISRWNLSATFVHATGTPYTKAAYGYIIGENFICEYFPHNSSRLPSYNRLDLSADYRFGSEKCRQNINISLFNALFNHNVLFTYITYSPKTGLKHRKTGLSTAIPSISYTFSF